MESSNKAMIEKKIAIINHEKNICVIAIFPVWVLPSSILSSLIHTTPSPLLYEFQG
jgi:hypothetical protein